MFSKSKKARSVSEVRVTARWIDGKRPLVRLQRQQLRIRRLLARSCVAFVPGKHASRRVSCKSASSASCLEWSDRNRGLREAQGTGAEGQSWRGRKARFDACFFGLLAGSSVWGRHHASMQASLAVTTADWQPRLAGTVAFGGALAGRGLEGPLVRVTGGVKSWSLAVLYPGDLQLAEGVDISG